MKNKLCSVLFAAALTSLSANAQALHVRAKVPFSFRIGNIVLPAGEYDLTESMSLLSLRQVDGYACLFQRMLPASKANAPGENRVRFTRYGDEYYLTSLWNPNAHSGEALPMTKHEKELAMQMQHVEMASIALVSSR